MIHQARLSRAFCFSSKRERGAKATMIAPPALGTKAATRSMPRAAIMHTGATPTFPRSACERLDLNAKRAAGDFRSPSPSIDAVHMKRAAIMPAQQAACDPFAPIAAGALHFKRAKKLGVQSGQKLLRFDNHLMAKRGH